MKILEILHIIMLFITLSVSLNALLKFPFDKLTIFNKKDEFHYLPTWFILSFMFFGFLMFPFYKRLREFRKVLYMKNVVRQYEFNNLIFDKYGFGHDDEYHKRYLSFKRYLQLKKLKRRI